MNRVFAGGLLTAALLGCGDNEECKKLTVLSDSYDKVAASVTARGMTLSKLEARAKDAENQAEKFIETAGLEMKVPEVTAELSKRLQGVAGATVTAGMASLGVTEDGAPIETQEWIVKLKEPQLDKAWKIIEAVSTVPPVLDLTTIIKERGKPDWRLSMQALRMDRVPVKPKPYPTPKLEDPATIPSQFGFCGASELRAHIADQQAVIEKGKAAAERVTVLLPTIATFSGLKRRAQAVVNQQRFARGVMAEAYQAVMKAKLDFKAVGHEPPAVVVEIWGEPKAVQAKLDAALIKFADRMRPAEQRAPGVTRVFINVEGAAQPEDRDHDPPMPE